MNNDKTSFYILVSRILHNYFDGLTKLFSDLYLTKFVKCFKKIVLCVQLRVYQNF